jgi:hypothetical protein
VEDRARTFPTAILAEPFPGAAPPFGSKDEDDDEDESDETATSAITAEPFPGAAPPFGSKDEDSEEDEEVEEDESEDTLASHISWACDTLTSDPTEHEDAVDHSKDGEARDNSFPETRYPHDRVGGGFAAANRLVAPFFVSFLNKIAAKDTGLPGITSPVSKLPPAPPGAADRAKERSKLGRGIEGDGDDGIDPMSTMDKFNWDNLPLPGLGQI